MVTPRTSIIHEENEVEEKARATGGWKGVKTGWSLLLDGLGMPECHGGGTKLSQGHFPVARSLPRQY